MSDAGTPPEGGLAEAQIAAIERAFAVRDRRFAALRDELSALRPGGGDNARLALIERRLDEQEEALREMLTTLVRYFEAGHA